jgi:hypothetical protein
MSVEHARKLILDPGRRAEEHHVNVQEIALRPCLAPLITCFPEPVV